MNSASDHEVRRIAEGTGDIIVSVDRAGTITYASPAIRTFGYAPEDLVGQTGLAFVHPKDRGRFAENTAALLRGELIAGADRQHRFRRADGRWAWVEGAPQLLRDETGELLGFVNALRDVTARRQAEAALRESEARFKLIAESSPDIILQTDRRGRMVFVSPAVRAYGYEPADLLGREQAEFVHADDLAQVTANQRQTLQDEVVEDPGRRANRYRTADGRWIWLEGNPRALHDDGGEVIGTVNVLRDVTTRRAQSDLFETAFVHAAIGKALVGLDGRFLRVNAAFARMLGYTATELLGLDFQTLTHPDDLDTDLALLGQLIGGEIESYTLDKRYVRKDGALVWGRLAASMVRGPDGAPTHFIAEIQDQTDQHRAETALRESEARHRVIAEATVDVITMARLDGTLTFVSPSVRQIGYEPEALVGSTFAANIHPDDLKATWRSLEALMAGGPCKRHRWRARHGQTGEWLWMDSAPSLTRDPVTGRPNGLIDVVRDISRQVEQEEALKAARETAEAATAVKAQFVANMSHEIRNPLTAVIGFTDMLRKSPTLAMSDRAYVERIAGAGSALLAIVNDVLDFSKLESGMVTIRPKPTALAELARESLQLFEGQAAAKGLALVFEADDRLPPMALLDGDRLRQILINLTANAVKFTDAGTVTLRALRAGETKVRFEVSDTGAGLSEADMARLFQRFTQIDGADAGRRGGAGLGLAICKGLAEAMGGEVGVESTLGIGSTFHVTLPLTPDTTPAVAAESPVEGAPLAGVRVLVVDDHPANRELAALQLQSLGADVATAESGIVALDHLAAHPFDALLLDLRMPHLDGPEVLRRLRAQPGPNQAIPVVAFTAEVHDEGTAAPEGFDAMVGKPIDIAALASALSAAVDRANT
ncbi:MAG: PAS domain S-box protein [Phenylobacterium sp.]|uniref:hybrid sensor histidine kinase/response regulator n=1 Tax=Phenylobacterium sp. TaxID=1871053 RepID=UPI001A330867|nr:PAS domain S-box protein [Phenylobacterium sp.]MBJ7410621.1 PAS domain S-box protein [Phenylobacterium sp.]